MFHRETALVALVALVALAGCTNPVTQQTLTFTATPVAVDGNAVAAAGYSSHSSGWQNVTRNVSLAGQQRTLELNNYVAEYRRALGNGSQAGFGVLATPQANVAGQSLNPISGWSMRRLVRDIPNPYGSLSNVRSQGTQPVTLLGTQTQASLFSATSASGTPVTALVARVEHGDDIVVAGAVAPQGVDETERTLELFPAVRHPPTEGPDEEARQDNESISVEELNRNAGEYVGERVRVKGYYSERSVPMLVADYRDAVTNEPFPEYGYVPLAPDSAQEQLSGEQEGHTVVVEALVRERRRDRARPDRADTEGASIWTADVELTVESVEILRIEPEIRRWITLPPDQFIPPDPVTSRQDCRFAVIVSGGVNAASNYQRYWDGVVQTYQAMNGAYNVPDDQIYVNYFKGSGEAQVNGRNIVDASARQSDVDSTLNDLQSEVARCQNATKKGIRTEIMMFTYNHGSYDQGKNLIGSQVLTPDELRDHFVDIRMAGADEINVMMMQCYSAQFIDLTSGLSGRSTKGTVTAIATAAKNDEVSYGKDFGWDFVAGLAGAYPNGTSVNADADGDGDVSWNEAFLFAKRHDKWGPNGRGKEHPQFFNNLRWLDPDGDGVHSNYDNQPNTHNPNQ